MSNLNIAFFEVTNKAVLLVSPTLRTMRAILESGEVIGKVMNVEDVGVSLNCREEHRDHEIEKHKHVVVEETLRDERLPGRGTLETEESCISAASLVAL